MVHKVSSHPSCIQHEGWLETLWTVHQSLCTTTQTSSHSPPPGAGICWFCTGNIGCCCCCWFNCCCWSPGTAMPPGWWGWGTALLLGFDGPMMWLMRESASIFLVPTVLNSRSFFCCSWNWRALMACSIFFRCSSIILAWWATILLGSGREWINIPHNHNT